MFTGLKYSNIIFLMLCLKKIHFRGLFNDTVSTADYIALSGRKSVER